MSQRQVGVHAMRGSGDPFPRSSGLRLALLVAILSSPTVLAQEGSPLSPRNASYEIDVVLDAGARTLSGRQILTWTNLGTEPTEELRFHLYWNAWRNNRSTWMQEDRVRGRSDRGDSIREEDWSWIEVDAARVLDGDDAIDLTRSLRFDSPDDGNPDDRTVLVATLPAPVGPGATVRVEMEWHAKIPRTFARTGYRGNYFLLAHWFPKIGVYREGEWNCHQYHAGTEYFSDYGSYDVRMTIPAGWVLGATGREVERADNGDGTVTVRYTQDDVHAFTWTVSPDYVVIEERFEEAGLPAVDLRLLMQPEHLGQAPRHLDATRAALKHYGSWFGPYPYGHVTVIDPAYGSGAGGMEYPTLFTCGTRVFNPFGGDSPESVTVHEAGHQFWYGIVGNNEFQDAWIDEGFNTYSTLRTLEVVYGDRMLVRRYVPPPGAEGRGRGSFFPLAFPDIKVDRWAERVDRYRSTAPADDPDTWTFLYFPSSGGNISYSKTALWLRTLENHLGWETLQGILSTFFERHKFDHPTPEDFLAVADEVSGQDLSWFFDQVFRDSVRFDYSVRSVDSKPVAIEGFVDENGALAYRPPSDDEEDDEGDGPYRTEVTVQRLEDGVFPVEVLMVFEDGHEVREAWDGAGRWRSFVIEHEAKIAHAVVDPEGVLALDISPNNNSRRREPAPNLASRKWGSKWMIWLQDLLISFAFFG